MKLPRPSFLAMALLAAVATAQRIAPPADQQTESEHRKGPDGLEGWTMDGSLPAELGHAGEQFPFSIVIAKNGQVLQHIDGDPFIWSWVFWADGKQLAYATGPLHFGETCILIRLSDGRQLADYDCYNETPSPKPDWVKAIEAAP